MHSKYCRGQNTSANIEELACISMGGLCSGVPPSNMWKCYIAYSYFMRNGQLICFLLQISRSSQCIKRTNRTIWVSEIWLGDGEGGFGRSGCEDERSVEGERQSLTESYSWEGKLRFELRWWNRHWKKWLWGWETSCSRKTEPYRVLLLRR